MELLCIQSLVLKSKKGEGKECLLISYDNARHLTVNTFYFAVWIIQKSSHDYRFVVGKSEAQRLSFTSQVPGLGSYKAFMEFRTLVWKTEFLPSFTLCWVGSRFRSRETRPAAASAASKLLGGGGWCIMSIRGDGVYWKVRSALPASGHNLFHCSLTVSCFPLPDCDDICGYHEYPCRCFLPPVILDSHFNSESALAPSFPTRVLEAFPGPLFPKDKSQKAQGEQKRNLKKLDSNSWPLQLFPFSFCLSWFPSLSPVPITSPWIL